MEVCEECGGPLQEFTEGYVCVQCGVVAKDILCAHHTWNDHSDIAHQNVVSDRRLNTLQKMITTTDKSLLEDFQTIEYIAQLYEDTSGVVELAKEYAQTVKRGLVVSGSKHKSYRGRQRAAVMVACWVCACKQHNRDISPSTCSEIVQRLPNCEQLDLQKCCKYYSDGRKIVETVLSEQNIMRFTDNKKYEMYLLSMGNLLKAKNVHQYSLKLVDAIQALGHKGSCFLQAHTPENLAAALFHKASQVSERTYIEPQRIVDTLGEMGHRVCVATVDDICRHIENIFQRQNEDEDKTIEHLLATEKPPTVFVAQIVPNEQQRFMELLRIHNLK